MCIVSTPVFADSHGKFPGRGSEEAYNKSVEIEKKALDCANKGDFQSAEKYDTEAISIYPYDSGFYSNLGQDLKKLGKTEESRKAFERAVALEPNYAHAWISIGYSYEKQRNLAEAERYYRRAVAIESDWNALCSLGDILRQEGRFDESRKSLTRARACTLNDHDAALVDKCLEMCNQHKVASD